MKYVLLIATLLGIGTARAQNIIDPNGGGGGGVIASSTTLGAALGPLINFNGSGLPGILLGSRMIIGRQTTAATDFADLQVSRVTTFTGGSGLQNSGLYVPITIGANDASSEWGLLVAAGTNGNAGGNTVGAFLQATKKTGSTDFVAAMIADLNDVTDLPSSQTGSGYVGQELDLATNQADDATNGNTFGGVGNRKVTHILAIRQLGSDTTQTTVSNGIWFGTANNEGGLPVPDAHTNFMSAIGFTVNTQTNNALDTRGAIPPTGSGTPMAAVVMSAGHVIDFKGGTTMTSAPGRYLSYVTGSTALQYSNAGTTLLSIADTGATTITGTLSSAGITDSGSLQIGSTTPLTLANGEFGLIKETASGTAPGAAGLKLTVVCGTGGGSAKLIAYAGTSTTPVTVLDNIGSGVTGC